MGSQKFKWFLVVTSQMSATSGKGVNNELFICSPFLLLLLLLLFCLHNTPLQPLCINDYVTIVNRKKTLIQINCVHGYKTND